MKKVTGSKAVIKSLLKEKVDTIFGYPGGAIVPIYDSLYESVRTIKTQDQPYLWQCKTLV